MVRNNLKKLAVLSFAVVVFGLFQNCNQNYKIKEIETAASAKFQSASASLTVGAAHPNPPLDLFFIIDNSASMLGHQIDLGNAFASVFQSNQASLANFDVNVYVFTTGSTVNTSYLSSIPTALQASITSIPPVSDVANLVKVPGSIFGIRNTASGVYGTAPYSESFFPAAVLDYDPDALAITPAIHILQKGNQSNQQYAANLANLTAKFQNRLTYLNPTNQLAYSNLTDISSGLCSIARILKHPENFIQTGDAAAFVIVSDDNDRLNVRNPNNNQCLESIIGANQVIDGTCGHNVSTFNYNSTASITYQSNSKFKYQFGTQIPYSYVSGETCSFTYTNGFKYTSTYTAIKTSVSYTKCTKMADGVCLSTAPATQVVDGNYVGSGTNCSQSMAGLVDSPVGNSSFACSAANVANVAGASGVDTASNGSACSTSVLNVLAGSNKKDIVCTIGSQNVASGSAASQAVGSCSNYCSVNAAKYPSCTLTNTTPTKTNGNIALAVAGATCNSSCPDATKCGNSTISSYISSTYGATATCGTPVATLSTITVGLGSTSAGAALNCSSNLAGATVVDSNNKAICAGKATVQDCINSLVVGTPTSGCTVTTGDKATVAVGTNVGCSTTCANSNGFCDAPFGTVANYLATKGQLCVSSANGGAKSFQITFKPSVATAASCSSLCTDAINGSCDGKGWGAADGSTVSDYVKSLGGSSTCSTSIAYTADTASLSVDAANVSNACNDTPNSPIFKASGSAHPGSVITNYVAGNSSHLATDFHNFIYSQSSAVFGANNLPAVAVITKQAGDNLSGTDVGTDYINLASKMNSSQVSSILGNYSTSLSNISNFIVQATKNNYLLPIPSNATVYSITIIHNGVATQLPNTKWSMAGQTLSLSSNANVVIGDQIVFDYNVPTQFGSF